MWQYPAADVIDKAPEYVWENIPRWDDIERTKLEI